MSDPLKQIKQKLQDEITTLEHELNVELPKEIAVARAHGDLSLIHISPAALASRRSSSA